MTHPRFFSTLAMRAAALPLLVLASTTLVEDHPGQEI